MRIQPTLKLGISLFLGAFLFCTPAVLAQQAGAAKGKGGTKPPAVEKERLDLNKATEKELEELPGVGPATAKKIVEGRPYKSVEGLLKAGVSERALEKLKPLVIVHRPPAAKAGTAAAKDDADSGAIDLNKASQAELETLPGIGPVLAKEIVAGRPYKSLDDLGRVKGMGKAKIAAIKDRVHVGDDAKPGTAATKPTPTKPAAKKTASAKGAAGAKIDLNTASKEDLDALPGIGPVKAQAIIDARPFKTIDDIKKVRGIKDVEFSKIKDMITVN